MAYVTTFHREAALVSSHLVTHVGDTFPEQNH